jgi:cell shape-determining protein MreC
MSLAEILTLITAATSAVVAIINALKHRSTAHKVDTTLDIMAQTQGTVNKVQSLVNGQSEALRRALDVAQERCQALEAENAQLKGLS